jgi:hypothetical protein
MLMDLIIISIHIMIVIICKLSQIIIKIIINNKQIRNRIIIIVHH